MAKTNAENQAAFKKRMRDSGLVPVQLWIQPDRKSALEEFAKLLADGHTNMDLESAVKLVLDAGLSTGHADTCSELVEEVLSQYEELMRKL